MEKKLQIVMSGNWEIGQETNATVQVGDCEYW